MNRMIIQGVRQSISEKLWSLIYIYYIYYKTTYFNGINLSQSKSIEQILLITEISFLIYHFFNVLVEIVSYKSTDTTNTSFIQISTTLSTT